VDRCKKRYELFDSFDTNHNDPDDERYIIDVHRSLAWYELYLYGHFGGCERTGWFDNVIICYNVSTGGCHWTHGE
jgi:hypothetical protein